MVPHEDVDALGHGQSPREAARELALVPAPKLQPSVRLARLDEHHDSTRRDRFLDVVKRVLTTHAQLFAQLFAQLANAEAAPSPRQGGDEPILKVESPGGRA